MKLGIPTLTLVLTGTLAAARGQEASWPDLSTPAKAVGGGEHDAAVVVGVEDYAFVADVPGAESNAKRTPAGRPPPDPALPPASGSAATWYHA